MFQITHQAKLTACKWIATLTILPVLDPQHYLNYCLTDVFSEWRDRMEWWYLAFHHNAVVLQCETRVNQSEPTFSNPHLYGQAAYSSLITFQGR